MHQLYLPQLNIHSEQAEEAQKVLFLSHLIQTLALV